MTFTLSPSWLRRRGRVVVGLVAIPALFLSSASAPAGHAIVPTLAETGQAAPTAAAMSRCASVAADMTSSERIGQLLMVGISSNGLTSGQSRILARNHVGSVILLGNSKAGRTTVKGVSKKVHAIGGKPEGVGVMLTVDQEGGKVQRLQGPGFDRIPSARSQAKMSSATLEAKSQRWAQQLRAAGIDANLAPVADVVPTRMEKTNQPIGVLRRGYGPDPDVVAAKVPAFLRGMSKGNVTTAVKHFPGLGRVRGNTDFSSKVTDTTTKRHDRALKGFAAGTEAGVDMVMVSSAYYSKIDPRNRAVFSKLIIGQLVRKDLGFAGVVISDDLSARAVLDKSPGNRAVSFLNAGGDLIIVGDATEAPAMVKAIKAKAAKDRGFRAELQRKTTRVLQMKARQGLTRCS